jgi:protein involved in polysaccharide export with SLBB domain
MRRVLFVAALTVLTVVTASAQAARTVPVAGDVKKAGEYPFKEGLTVAMALSAAGGFSQRVINDANGVNIRLIRVQDGKRTICIASFDTQLKASDILIVDNLRLAGQAMCRE